MSSIVSWADVSYLCHTVNTAPSASLPSGRAGETLASAVFYLLQGPVTGPPANPGTPPSFMGMVGWPMGHARHVSYDSASWFPNIGTPTALASPVSGSAGNPHCYQRPYSLGAVIVNESSTANCGYTPSTAYSGWKDQYGGSYTAGVQITLPPLSATSGANCAAGTGLSCSAIDSAGSGTGTYSGSALALARTDSALSNGSPVGLVSFGGNDAASTPVFQNWGRFECDAAVTTGGSADAGLCRAWINNGGALSEMLDFKATYLSALQPMVFDGAASFSGAASFAAPSSSLTTFSGPVAFGTHAISPETFPPPVAGGGEVGNYTPLDVPATNLLVHNGSLCSSPGWACTNMTAPGSPGAISPDGSADMETISSAVTGPGYASQNISVSSTVAYTLSFYWHDNHVAMGGATILQAALLYPGSGGASRNCIYDVVTGALDVDANTYCNVFPVGNGNYRLVVSGANPGKTSATVRIYANGANGTTPAAKAITYCPQLEVVPAGTTYQYPIATRCLLTGAKTISRPPGGNAVYTILSESSGGTDTLSASSATDILTGSGTLSSLTLDMPSPPISGQPKRVVCNVGITAITWSGGSFSTTPPGTCTAGGSFTFRPSISGSTVTWYRVH